MHGPRFSCQAQSTIASVTRFMMSQNFQHTTVMPPLHLSTQTDYPVYSYLASEHRNTTILATTSRSPSQNSQVSQDRCNCKVCSHLRLSNGGGKLNSEVYATQPRSKKPNLLRVASSSQCLTKETLLVIERHAPCAPVPRIDTYSSC